VNPDQARSTRDCAFCGGAPARNAHVVPAWLRECFPHEASRAGLFGAKARVACKRCRNGWMSRLEKAAEPVLTLLIAGRPFVLAQQNQATLALWSAKTILMLETARNPRTFSPEVYRHLLEQREPPTGFRFALGIRAHEGEWPCRFEAQAFKAGNGRTSLLPTFPGMAIDTYRAGLCLGHLVVRTRATFAPDAERADPGDAASLAIWPPTAPARWPPRAGLVRMQESDSVFEPEAARAKRAA
jgi:hypothetical protein